MLSALHSTLAPEVAPIVDFRHHWNMFLKYYAKQPLGHKARPVESTNLALHLNAMLKILVREASRDCGGGGGRPEDGGEISMGPCMECLLDRQVLDVLSSVCQADVPPGIRPYIYKVFDFIVENIRTQSFLAYVSVYLPVRRLLMLSCAGKASPTESQEVAFLAALVARTKTDPGLLLLFAHDSRQTGDGGGSRCRSRSSSASADIAHIQKFLESSPDSACGGGGIGTEVQSAMSAQREDLFEKLESQHLLVACLINFLDSADYMVAFRAMELLLAVCQTREETGAAAENAVENTPLCAALAERAAALFRAIPPDVDPGSVEETRVNWVEEAHLLQQDQRQSTSQSPPGSSFQGRSELVRFFCWLDYCDTLAKESAAVISGAVAAALVDDFFVACVEGRLRDAAADGGAGASVAVTFLLAFLSQCWVHVRSEALAAEFSTWLFGAPADVTAHPLRRTLVGLCSSGDQDVCLEALRAFDVLLSTRPRDSVLQCLALSHLADRGYVDESAAESSIASWSDEEDEREMRQNRAVIQSTKSTPKSSPVREYHN